MKKAAALPQYADMREFQQPTGVVDVQLDKITNRLATPNCPDDYVSAFVAGTEPRDTCDAQARHERLLLAHVWRGQDSAAATGSGPARESGKIRIILTTPRKRRVSSARSQEYSRMTNPLRRCLNPQIAGRRRRIEGSLPELTRSVTWVPERFEAPTLKATIPKILRRTPKTVPECLRLAGGGLCRPAREVCWFPSRFLPFASVPCRACRWGRSHCRTSSGQAAAAADDRSSVARCDGLRSGGARRRVARAETLSRCARLLSRCAAKQFQTPRRMLNKVGLTRT